MLDESMFEDIHEIAENSAYLKAVEQKDVSLEMLEQLPPYGECRDIEEKLRADNKLTFESIFNEATGFYMIKCFGDDTRLLTDRGFLFLDELEALLSVGAAVRYAAYDAARKAVVYRPGRVVYPQGDGRLVNFTPAQESRRWTEGSGDYGVESEVGDKSSARSGSGGSDGCVLPSNASNRLSLRVTGDHDMYLQADSSAAYRKVPAGDLLRRSCVCSANAQPPCLHCRRPLRVLGHAASGLAEVEDRAAALPPIKALDLHSGAALDAFLELYGYWLSSGCVQLRQRPSAEDAVVFAPCQAADADFLLDRLGRAGVALREVRRQRQSGGSGASTLRLLSSRWVDFFCGEFSGAPVASAPLPSCRPTSPTCSPRSTSRSLVSCFSDEEEEDDVDAAELKSHAAPLKWALEGLDRRQMRLLLDGFRRASGVRVGPFDCLLTSSVPLRDALVVAALHAGYSAFFELHRRCAAKGSGRGEAEEWRVCYSDPASPAGRALCEPTFTASDAVVEEHYLGRIWCVTVEHADHLVFAQRAHRGAQGWVTKASQPIVVGQCFLIADYAVDKAIFIKDVEAYKSMRFESARRKVAALLYQRFVSTEEPQHAEYKHGVSVFQLIQQSKGAEEKKERDGKVQPASINLSASPSHAQSLELKTVLPPASPLHSVTAGTTNGHTVATLHPTVASQHLNGRQSPNPPVGHPNFPVAPPITPSSPSHAASTLLQMGTANNPIGVYGKSVRVVREKVNRGEAPKDLFDEVARDVMTDLKLDAFPRFKQGDFYRRYIRTKWIETQKVQVKDFTTFRVLGRGGFGAVHACRKKNSGQIYAMKCINKKLVKVKSALDNVLEERNVLTMMKSHFVTNLKYGLQDEDTLYLIMDLMLGGDLKFHLINAGRFTEKRARFYAAQVLLGLEHVHKLSIIYRDMKLENVLLDHQGHCRLSDLGLAVVTKVKIKGYAGTPGYTAPEMIKNKLYGPAADIFSYGVMLYRMLCGSKPFKGKVDRDLDKAVIERKPTFPKEIFSKEAISLLTGLLQKRPENRLGCGDRGIEEVKEHPFFESIDWGLLEAGYIDPPFVPNKFDVNAASLKDIGDFDRAKYKHVKLDDRFRQRIKNFEYVNVQALQDEMVQVLEKADEHVNFEKFAQQPHQQQQPQPQNGPACCSLA